MNEKEAMVHSIMRAVIDFYDDWEDDNRLEKVHRALRQIFPSYIVIAEYGSPNSCDCRGFGFHHVQVREKDYHEDYVCVTCGVSGIVNHSLYNQYLSEREFHFVDGGYWEHKDCNGLKVRTKA